MRLYVKFFELVITVILAGVLFFNSNLLPGFKDMNFGVFNILIDFAVAATIVESIDFILCEFMSGED